MFVAERSTSAPISIWALGFVVGALVFCVTIGMKAQVLASQDLYLHIAVGRWILANHLVPDHGIFSATMPDAPWVAHEWLASVGLAALYDHLGWGGVLAVTALLLAIAIGMLTSETALALGPIGAVVAAVLAWGICVHHLVARPHIASLPLVVIWIGAHVRARRANTTPPVYLALVMVLWANLHGAFMFGLAFTALFAGEALFESDTWARARNQALRWSAFLIVSVLAAMVTPEGLTGLLFPIHMLALGPALETVREWQASSLANNPPLLAWCVLLLFLVLWQGVRLPICRLLMLLLLLYMAFAHQRHAELLALAAPLLVQDAVAERLALSAPAFHDWGFLARPATGSILMAISVFAAGAAIVVGCRNIVRGPDEFTPAAALATIEARGITGPMFNAQKFGGYLIFRGYSPFIDGRVDMYGNDFMARYSSLGEFSSLLEQYRITWTILDPANPRTGMMDTMPGWSRLYADATAVVHIRKVSAANR